MHGLPSSHAAPIFVTASAQSPDFGAQTALLQGSSSAVGQVTTVSTGITHWPVLSSQTSTPLQRSSSPLAWHSASLLQVQSFLPALHTPAAQISCAVQALPSSHALPSLPRTQPPPTQAHAWQNEPSPPAQSAPVTHVQALAPALQLPDLQVSSLVQGLPSSQAAPSASGLPTQPAVGSHCSFSQGPPSPQGCGWLLGWQLHGTVCLSQWSGTHSAVPPQSASLVQPQTDLPPLQLPAVQVSPWVQGSPSLQALPSAMGIEAHWAVAGLQVQAVQGPVG